MLVGKQVGKKQKMNILKGVSGALKPVSCINTPQTGLDPLGSLTRTPFTCPRYKGNGLPLVYPRRPHCNTLSSVSVFVFPQTNQSYIQHTSLAFFHRASGYVQLSQ